MKPLFIYRIINLFTKTSEHWDVLSPTEDSAIAFGHSHINPEPDKQISPSMYSLEYCLAHCGESINDRYRQDRSDSDDKDIELMVASHKTKIDIVVYRGVCEHVMRLMKQNSSPYNNVDLYEKSFLQTSLVKGCESNSQYHLRIFVPSGTEAVYLGNVNDEQFFYEVDIQHGVKLKIISADKKYINCIIVK